MLFYKRLRCLIIFKEKITSYNFFSTKKNDVRILWNADETDLLRKDADLTDFNYINTKKKKPKEKNSFQSASSQKRIRFIGVLILGL
jgi:hypothetical protein